MPEKMFVAAKSLIKQENKILLIAEKRGNDVSYDLPGGRVDPGENPSEALVREVKEELGVGSKVVSELPIAIWSEQRKDPFIFLLYQIILDSDEYEFEKTNDGGVIEAKYFSLAEIESLDNLLRPKERLPVFRQLLK
jgi:8-oxo-dGTP pyrophosphatase MutT (NUDIX family)